MNYASKKVRIINVLEGLRNGLSQFCGPTRVALIYAEKPDDPLRIFDPDQLLEGHEPKLRKLYILSDKWRECDMSLEEMRSFGEIVAEEDVGLSGVISYGGRTGAVFYQMWFVDNHPDLCSVGPISKWLEHAVCLLSHDFVTEDAFYTASSRYVLREYGRYAVRDYILDALNLLVGWDMPYNVSQVLDVILGISKTREEGSLPEGILCIVDSKNLKELNFIARFPPFERPSLTNLKHVRKLLSAVKNNNLMLVSDGHYIVGISKNFPDVSGILADFRKSYGFVSLGQKKVCSFSDGKFYATNREPHLIELEELLWDAQLEEHIKDAIFGAALHIVRSAATNKHGCALVIDLNDPPLELSGQRIEPPLDLTAFDNICLASDLARLDGAVHIGKDLKLHAFSCLLDGPAVPNEDRSRGARYNSALRFTAHRSNVIVITVSSDRPVSIFQDGVDVTRRYFSHIKAPESVFEEPLTLEKWLAE